MMLKIFSKKGLTSLTGLMALFLKFASSGCNRELTGGKDTVGWYPLFGVTHCSPEELDRINKIRGRNRGSCGDNTSGGGLLDNILADADPYLTAAKNYVNGAYDLFIGTHTTATIQRKDNGTTHTSIKLVRKHTLNILSRKHCVNKNQILVKMN